MLHPTIPMRRQTQTHSLATALVPMGVIYQTYKQYGPHHPIAYTLSAVAATQGQLRERTAQKEQDQTVTSRQRTSSKPI